MKCPKCNSEQKDNKFCDNCGNKLDEVKEAIYCSNCGKKQMMANFCVDCGNKLVSVQGNTKSTNSDKTAINVFFIISIINLVFATPQIILLLVEIFVLPFALILGADVSNLLKSSALFLIYSILSIVFFITMLILHIKNK